MNLAYALRRTIIAAGVAIQEVEIGDPANKATWRVQPANLQAAAQATIDAFNPNAQATIDADDTARFGEWSRNKDVLTFCALVVRSRGIAAWNAMTIQQKKDATLAEADVARDIRAFVEQKL